MRRARIKAMASVPARRKPVRDVKDEIPETTKAETIVIDKEPANLSTPSSTEISEQSITTSPQLNTTKYDVDLNVEQRKIEPPKVDPPVSETNRESLEKMPEPREITIEKSLDPQKPVDYNVEQPNIEPPKVDPPVSEPNRKTFEKMPEPLDIKIEKSLDTQKPVVILDNNQGSGTEDTKGASTNIDTPPVAKTLQTRTSFMRPTPRLDGGGRMRRNSIQGSGASASESEDDTRRSTTGISSRVRNDSVVPSQYPKLRSQSNSTGYNTNTAETVIDGDSVTNSQTVNNTLASTMRRKRKMIISESARKLTEARREFLLKHEHKQPDKSKLIMYDLIYYNPVTNPMKKSDSSSIQKTSSSVITADTEDYKDEEDEPAEALPVPQVKVGPNGNLIIDQQSLVIEQTGAKKNRQALARAEALVVDEGNGSGFYKKRQKTQDWAKWETLKFYKALNTVGTDFLLMQSLFPKRARREIKQKFKKEEKINPQLVEKALTNYHEFDIESLKEDLATFEENVKKRLELQKNLERTGAQQRGRKRGRKKSRRMTERSISELNGSPEETECSPDRTTCADEESQEATSNGEHKKSRQRRTLTNDTPSRSELASSEESGSDTEIYNVKPTRSGRLPKVRKLQAPTIDNLENTDSDDEEDDGQNTKPNSPAEDTVLGNLRINETANEKTTTKVTSSDEDEPSWKTQHFPDSLSGISQVEPGSLVIVSRESADDSGETVLQVYMVSSDINKHGDGLKQNMTPVVLTPELLNTVTAGITKVAPIDVNPE